MKFSRAANDVHTARMIVSKQFEAETNEPDENFPWAKKRATNLQVIGYLPETTEAVLRNIKNNTYFAAIGNTLRQINYRDLEDISYERVK